MYRLTNEQIDFINNDIRARGVEMDSLRENLLDHVCCIIENKLEENGDFDSFYQSTIRAFYKEHLWEIEEETISLLIFKNYYLMKKFMIINGIFSAFAIMAGICFKLMHWPGAALIMPLGLFSASLVFLPLLFTLKAREQQNRRDKFLIATGALAAIAISLSFLFKILRLPGAMYMFYGSLTIMLIIFLPVYFFGGIRNQATKVNTITTSVLIILCCGLQFSLLRTPRSEAMSKLACTQDFVRSEQILNMERQLSGNTAKSDTLSAIAYKINALCEMVKSEILVAETGQKTIGADFENTNVLLSDRGSNISPDIQHSLDGIRRLVTDYNLMIKEGLQPIPVKASFAGPGGVENIYMISTVGLLNEVIQVQMFLLQNERKLLAEK
jgi:hypothetical protein